MWQLFNTIYSENVEKKTITFFNIPIYEIISCENYRKQIFLFGIIKTYKNYSPEEKITYILGLPLIKHIYTENKDKYYFYIPPFFIKNRKNTLKNLKKYLNLIPQKYEHVFVINSCIGECFLFLNLFQKYIENNNFKNCIFVALKKVHIDLIKMICPNIPYILIPELSYFLNENFNEYSNQKFYIFYEPIYFVNVENNMRQKTIGSVHFFDFILEKLNIKKEDFEIQKIKITQEEEKIVLQKAKKIGLNLNNFIFISNETTSSEKNEKIFWKETVKELRIQGFDIFQNATNKKNLLTGVKNFKLSIKEALILSKYAKSIVMYRSGLADVLALANVPMHVIYTNFKERGFLAEMSSDKVLNGFTLSKLPYGNQNNFYEYDANLYNTPKIFIETVMKNIKRVV